MSDCASRIGLPKEALAEIDGLISEYIKGSAVTARIVSSKDRIVELLEKHGKIYNLQAQSKFVGIHPSNRDNEGISWKRVETRGAKINALGFSWESCKNDCIAFEDDPVTQAIADHTLQVTSMSNRFAKYDKSDIKYGSVGAGHLNHLLISACQGVECDDPNISENGKYSKPKLIESGFQEALDKGLRWKIIRFDVEKRFPKLPVLIQAALNAVGQIQDGAPTSLNRQSLNIELNSKSESITIELNSNSERRRSASV